MPALLLRFFRTGFEVLEAIKLDMANAHLSQLLEADPSLRHSIASRPNDFVVLLNATDAEATLAALGDDGSAGVDLGLPPLHDPHGADLAGVHMHHGGLRLHEAQHPLSLGGGLGGGDDAAGVGSCSASGCVSSLGGALGAASSVSAGASGLGGSLGGVDLSMLAVPPDSGPPIDSLQARLRRRYLDDHAEGGASGDDGGDTRRSDGDEADDDGEEEDDGEDDGAYDDDDHRLSYEGHYGMGVHHHHHSPHELDIDSPHGGLDGELGSELPVAPEMHSELMEAVMQQWLHTPAGQSAANEAARLELSSDEVGQFFHARMLQSLGRLRIGGATEPSLEQMRAAVGSLPENDEEAVQRLVALGFPREQAAEAYLACDRNEMLAANFLMDHQ